jgi:uncharacterized membrane protein (DUF4010 family)
VRARRAGQAAGHLAQAQTGIILATAIMYVRLLIVVGLFDRSLALTLAPAMAMLAAVGVALAGLWRFASHAASRAASRDGAPGNPLELAPALVFAALFIVVSLAAAWVRLRFGTRGVYALAGIVGLTDIDPFVLSIASGGATPLPGHTAAAAVLIATSSNNVLKAAYTIGFAGFRAALPPALGLGGSAAAWWVVQ